MIKNVLIPTDFSACSLNALEYALDLMSALNPDAKLVVLSAYNIPLAYSDINISFGTGDSEIDLTAYIDEEFEKLDRNITKLSEFKHEKVKISNFVKEAVEEYCDENEVDLIVMGTTGASGLKEVFIGTNTERIIKSVEIPVLAIPEETKFKPYKQIALSSDYEPMKPTVLKPLKDITIGSNATLHLAHVESTLLLEDDKANAAKNLNSQLKDVKHEFHYLVNEDVEQGLKDFINKQSVDLLAIYPRKKGIIERVFTRSKSKSIIYHTEIPLLALS